MLTKLRTYGFLIFLVPVGVFFVDDYLTQWHDHGHETVRRIIWENLAEDVAVLLATFIYDQWQARVSASVHCECPRCHFRWMMHPKQVMLACPRCHRPEYD